MGREGRGGEGRGGEGREGEGRGGEGENSVCLDQPGGGCPRDEVHSLPTSQVPLEGVCMNGLFIHP